MCVLGGARPAFFVKMGLERTGTKFTVTDDISVRFSFVVAARSSSYLIISVLPNLETL